MGKALLALGCALLAAMMPSEGARMAAPDIGIDPIPPTQGGTMTVTAPGPYPRKIRVQFDNDDPFLIEITSSRGTDVAVPGDAEDVLCTDPNGVLTGNGSVIDPSGFTDRFARAGG